MPETNDAHKREEEERRAKRKAAKSSKSASQLEKERRAKEHREKILKQTGSIKNIKGSETESSKHGSAPIAGSKFQKLFETRSQGFQIEFRFRNAPPRPPVGPIFVGQPLDVVLQEQSQQYKTLNSVEVNHRWELHTENELGVPLAACAMDIQSYQKTSDGTKLHPDDHALLDWKGSMGDTAAEELKIRQDRARAAARAALTGRAMPVKLTTNATGMTAKTKKAKFSRVLDEGMQTWMKKTTYLSNDYSRKVHDFKSLAKTKQELALELEQKRLEISKKRSVAAIAQSFDTTKIEHPSKKKLKVKRTYPLLPNVQAWGKAHTHIIIDKAPTTAKPYSLRDLKKGLIANVEKPDDKPKMACDVFVPAKEVEKEDQYQAVQSYDLDIIPLKDDDSPQMHFCFWIDKEKGLATYLPLPSRVQLSTGRPLREVVYRGVQRRPLTEEEIKEEEERTAEINEELAEKYNLTKTVKPSDIPKGDEAPRKKIIEDGDGDGEDDFGDDFGDDDSSDDEAHFGSGTKTIEAQS